MPRIKTKPVYWKLTIDERLAARVELALADMSQGKPIYGARSALITVLVRNWLDGTPLPTPTDPNLIDQLGELTDADDHN